MSEMHAHTNHVSANQLIKHTLLSKADNCSQVSSNGFHPSSFGQNRKPKKMALNEPPEKIFSKMALNEPPEKIFSKTRAEHGHTNSVQKKRNHESHISSTVRRSGIERARLVVSLTSDKHEDRVASVGSQSELLVSALKPFRCRNKGPMETESGSFVCAASGTTAQVGTSTSTLLSLISGAVSVPRFTAHTCISSTASEYPACPTRDSWPLLREMISKPPVTVVSISPAPRQTLSTVQLQPAHEEPKARLVSKLQKEIKCECKFNRGQPCWFLFQEDRLRKERLHHLTLKRESLDLVILAKIAANINREEKSKKCHGRDRQRCRVCYYHEGQQICRETFMFIHGICKGRMCALLQHYKKKGLSIRVHGNRANIPHHALSDEDSERVIDFIRKYANNHCLSTFGHEPQSKALLIMSATKSKMSVHHQYRLWCSENKHRVVSLRSFQNLWTKHLPYIVVLRGSNKTPVPESTSHQDVLALPEEVDFEDETVPEVSTEGNVHLPLSSVSCMNTEGTAREVDVVRSEVSRQSHCDSSTQADLDCFTKVKIIRKRKSLPPRKVKMSSGLPESAEGDLKAKYILGEPHVMHTVIGRDCTDISLKITDNSSDARGIQGPLQQMDSHPPFFNGEHISHITDLLQSHPTVAGDGQTTVTLLGSKDIRYKMNKPCIPLTTTTSSYPPQCLPQPSQLMDTNCMPCCDTSVLSHDLCEQTQSVLLSSQGSDLSNIHLLDWQTWHSYSEF
ncbi:unnamed protein product [Candidula unifasciata]|uniref:Uncharacterized protein n=1 Tax=Candidula unifasciata TaxID=100452 RepID=A0A8S3YJH8_9EUPU|nr:unnamed protein product [Candidula unifasciata]